MQNVPSICDEITRLKDSRRAVIMAHNYVLPEVQDIADFVGDSLELSIRAKENRAETIVFCGVRFMAETAKLLSPAAKVLMPSPLAGCPMADMCTVTRLREYREKNPDTVIIAYVNSTAAVKAIVDVCCTSGNAERVVASIPENRKILFLPDRNLGSFVANKLHRKIELWDGCCPIHDGIQLEQVLDAKKCHPKASTLAHPECRAELIQHVDAALSTAGMLKFVENSNNDEFLVITEIGMLHKLEKTFPEKKFYGLPTNPPICLDMKKITLENLLTCLRDETNLVTLPDDIMRDAVKPIERMLAL